MMTGYFTLVVAAYCTLRILEIVLDRSEGRDGKEPSGRDMALMLIGIAALGFLFLRTIGVLTYATEL